MRHIILSFIVGTLVGCVIGMAIVKQEVKSLTERLNVQEHATLYYANQRPAVIDTIYTMTINDCIDTTNSSHTR